MQVPYETLNKRFRAAQKNIDRETSHVTMVVTELEKTLSSSFPVVDSVVSLLDGVVEKLSALKRKVSPRSNIPQRAKHLIVYICNKGCLMALLHQADSGRSSNPFQVFHSQQQNATGQKKKKPSLVRGFKVSFSVI